jgi:hypothetical protein
MKRRRFSEFLYALRRLLGVPRVWASAGALSGITKLALSLNCPLDILVLSFDTVGADRVSESDSFLLSDFGTAPSA